MNEEQTERLIAVLENISNTLADIHTDMIGQEIFIDNMNALIYAVRKEY